MLGAIGVGIVMALFSGSNGAFGVQDLFTACSLAGFGQAFLVFKLIHLLPVVGLQSFSVSVAVCNEVVGVLCS